MIYHRRVKVPVRRGVRARRAAACLLRALAVVCALGSTAWAQGVDARSLSGVVVDQNQAPVAGATVALRETGPAPVERRTTDARGEFNFERAPSRSFTLTVEARGFEGFERQLDAGETFGGTLRVVLAPAHHAREVVSP